MKKRLTIGLILACLLVASAGAQTPQPEVSYSDDFQSYGTQGNPPGWVDTSVGSTHPAASGLYKTWPDPLAAANIVFGTKQSSGKPEGTNPRIGTFSTLTTKTFSGKGRFELRGRFLRTDADSRIGLTFFSSYPERDSYYLFGLWSDPSSTSALTMQLFGFGTTPSGKTNSGFTPEPNKWYRFLIQADDTDNTTFLRARFWLDGTAEPQSFSIDANDAASTRLTAGRIGLWSAVKGDAYVDDLSAKSPVDHTPPVIRFVNAATGQTLEPSLLALFNAPARIEIKVTDDLSTFVSTATLDDTSDYASGSPIAADGPHKITVRAVDGPGNVATASLQLFVDQTPPQLALKANGTPLANDSIFDRDLQITAEATDISPVTTTALLNGVAVGLPLAVSEEKVGHAVTVTATDRAGWQTNVSRTFTIDKSGPVIDVFANDKALVDGASFRQAALRWNATDLTLDNVTATLDGEAVVSGIVVTSETPAPHRLVLRATDKAGHSTEIVRSFVVRTTAPEVTILANGQPVGAKTSFNQGLAFTIRVVDTTATTTTVTLDDQPYTQGTLVGAAGRHTIKVVAKNAVDLETQSLFAFTIDYNPPALTLTESGSAFVDGMKFARNITPVASATDDYSEKPKLLLLIDGREHTSGALFAEEAADHSIELRATDDAGNASSLGPYHFLLDRSKPLVTIADGDGKPFAADVLFAKPVAVTVRVADITAVRLEATLAGAPLGFGSGQGQSEGTVVFTSAPIARDGTHLVSVAATDAAGNASEPATASFTIDTTPPLLTFRVPKSDAVVATPLLAVEGESDDARSVTVAGRAALVDPTAKTFSIADLPLLEGRNELLAIGTDRAGNVGQATLIVHLDTRAPELSVVEPLAGSCLNASELVVRGRVADAHLGSVSVSLAGGESRAATLAGQEFTATLPAATEGRAVLTVVATDAASHSSTATLPLTIDRTAPIIEVSANGTPFEGGFVNRPVALFVRALDAASPTTFSATLDGAPYSSGTLVSQQRDYTLKVTAADCAGNRAAEKTIAFTIDTTAPKIVSIDPAAGALVPAKQKSITGTVDEPLRSLVIEGGAAATLSGTSFTFPSQEFAEGVNELLLVAVDRAGNETRVPYSFRVKSIAPLVSIVENGGAIPPNAIYNRAVTPVVLVSEPAIQPQATLDGAAFASGTPVTSDGTHTLTASATDSLGHRSENATATFVIDRTPPAITITEPQEGAKLASASVEAKVSVSDDVASVSINGIAAVAAGTVWSATLPLDPGPNTITAMATDRAGNTAVARREVTRDDHRAGIIITTPQEPAKTNRRTIVVAGQLLTPNGSKVMLGGIEVTPDPAGVFRRTDVALVEGDNAITATIAGTTNSATVHVLADFTPPSLKVLANGSEFSSGDRFATSPDLTLQASDNNSEGLTTKLTIDGSDSRPATLSDGGHALVAVARDAAGNETRVERTFFVGSASSSVSGCELTAFDPRDGSGVFAESVRLTGRSGGAAGVRVNGSPADVAAGTFAASVPLGQEGANPIVVECVDSSGLRIGDSARITLYRWTGAPSIAITSPVAGDVRHEASVTVTGTTGNGVIDGDVNGVPFKIAEGQTSFAVVVPLANGLNILTARARNAANRFATTSIQVRRLAGTPQLAITSPLPDSETGASSIDVSGTWSNIDPSTLAISAGTAQPAVNVAQQSETTGAFSATVPLAAGTNVIPVSARNRAGVEASASLTVVQNAALPSISITAPADQRFYPASATRPETIRGTISPIPGSSVQVNGVTATVDGNFTFSADVDFAATGSGPTPIVAHVVTPEGRTASDIVTVTRLPKLTVTRTFPENDASVSPGILILLDFSNPIDRATAANGALRLTDAAGNEITGVTFVDRDIVSFAPAVTLAAGGRYTLTIGTAIRDLAGQSLETPYTFSFTTASTAPAVKPAIDETDRTDCLTAAEISGTASVAGARVVLDLDGTRRTSATADSSRKFTLRFSFDGQPGFHIARVREEGADGSLSPEATVRYRIDCAGPQVVSAILDRTAKTLAIQFSKAMKGTSLVYGTSVLLDPSIAGTLSLNAAGDRATIALSGSIPDPLRLVVRKEVEDASGRQMAADYTQSFSASAGAPNGGGEGFIAGAVYDASTGRPLEAATITIKTPARAFGRNGATISSTMGSTAGSTMGSTAGSTFVQGTQTASRLTPVVLAGGTPATSDRGRYTSGALAEGPYTIEVAKSGYTTVWRQVVVPAGAGVIPLDVRLTPRSASGITFVDAQSLTGLLPLGWSPIAAAEVTSAATSITFTVPAAEIVAAAQTLTAVQYDSDRDEWRVLAAAANAGSDGTVVVPISGPGNYALVYPDKAPGLAQPPLPTGGAALQPVVNPCSTAPDICRLTTADVVSFEFAPKTILPSQTAVATLTMKGTRPYPSGTAVQAYVDEQLNLADGSVVIDPPFATDLIVHRTLSGTTGVAAFRLKPTPQAEAATLRDGVEHVRIVEHPGRVDRGALIGLEGGRVPSDGGVSIELPAGAVTEPVHASVSAVTDLAQFGTIAGFRVVTAFSFTTGGVTLLKPARATFSVAPPNAQTVVAEELAKTPYGVIYRLASVTAMTSMTSNLFTTTSRADLPLDGIVREGIYLILAAENPIAFAYGKVVFANNAPASSARVTPSSLGVADLTRLAGDFVVPVPAAAFSLVPRHTATGDGAPYTATNAPAIDAVVNAGTLTLTAQSPKLVKVTPAGEIDATSGLAVSAEFDRAIDTTALARAIAVTNLTTNAALAGNLGGAGNTVTFTATQPLVAGSRYAITIAPTIRSTTGAPFGHTVVSSFSTRAIPAATTFTIKPELLRITIPDANGKSVVSGAGGAIQGPSRFQLVPTRRGRAFVTQYQTTIDSGAPFTIDIGTSASDRITSTDAIDLRVIDLGSQATVAIVPLTPFMTASGDGFLAPAGVTTKFSLADGTTVTVPAGAFDEPTLVTLAKTDKQTFAAVPNFDAELNFAGGVRINFNGIAKQPLELEIPIPAGIDTASRSFVLGHLGDSMRGPRIMIVDTLRVANGKFTTADVATAGASRQATITAVSRTSATLFGEPVKKYLLHAIESGAYAAVDFVSQPGSNVGWGVIDGLQGSYDLFFDKLQSLYASHLYMTEGRGRVVVPMPSNVKFGIEGVDAATGLSAFTQTYQFDSSTPGFAAVLPSPSSVGSGPYPLFGAPFRVETIDLVAKEIDLTSVRGYSVKLTGGGASITPDGGDPAPTVLNVTKGQFGGAGATLNDRLVLLIPEKDVDPSSAMRVVFNIPIALANDSDAAAVDASLRQLMSLQRCTGSACVDITAEPTFAIDGSHRVVTISLTGELQRGAKYRLRLSRNISEVAAPGVSARKLAQINPGTALSDDLYLSFTVREPKGSLGTTTLANGVIRDLALDGNLLFVSALDGGLQAFDASNPVALSGTPMATAPPPPGGESWGVVTDHHGRVFSTALSSTFGVVRSYRVKDFLAGGEVAQRANAIVSWRPGTNSGLPLGTTYTTLSDRPEATPRKIQLTTGDDEETFGDRAAFEAATITSPGANIPKAKAVAGTTYGEFRSYTVTVPFSAANPYRVQPATVENLTMGLRWSADAVDGQQAVINGVLLRAGDRMRISRNRVAYAVVALFGYGIGVVDLNAMESNAWPNAPAAYKPLGTLVGATSAELTPACAGEPCPIANLTFSPESVITPAPASPFQEPGTPTSPEPSGSPAGSGKFNIVALESTRGLVELTVASDTDPKLQRNGPGLSLTTRSTPPVEHPRLATLRAQSRGSSLVARFNSISRYTQSDGRTFALVAGAHYGLLVFDFSTALSESSLADIIWIPAGAWGVRVIDGSHFAAVVDGAGRTLLVDLSRIDERPSVTEPECTAADCPSRLFPTVKKALVAGAVSATDFGSDDPRVLWKSAPNTTATTLPPVADTDTGILYSGQLLTKTLEKIASVDPRLRVLGDTGSGLTDLGSLVPLGISPDVAVPPGSRAAFKIEAILPSGIGAIRLAVENERVGGVTTEQTPAPLPKSRLSELAPRPTTVILDRVIPATVLAANPELKFQRGANRFTSPWFVALADPRASKDYAWGGATAAAKAAAGCYSCDRPASLPADALEIDSLGRFIAVRPEANAFSDGYGYLNEPGRLEARITTVPADTVRPTHVLSAAQNPPFASGALQGSVLLHSGEMVESRVDLDAGGRAGWNVLFDRTYRSRTLGGTAFGLGWESSILRRLRALPNGNVEYRDGSGEEWLFTMSGGSEYTSPKGLYLKLYRTDRGYTLVDAKRRVTTFDDLGRLVSESDQFYTLAGAGNRIRYLYGSDGRLASIIDPVGRRSTLEYYAEGEPGAGLLKRITDWRDRTVEYRYDAQGRLTKALLPKTKNTHYLEFDHSNDSTRPIETYGYPAAAADYSSAIELATNLRTIQEPADTTARLTIGYYDSGNRRDMVKSESWGTLDNAAASYDYTIDSPLKTAHEAVVVDALQQSRTYKIGALQPGDYTSDRVHLDELIEPGVPVWSAAAFGQLPSALLPTTADTTMAQRNTTFSYASDGRLLTTKRSSSLGDISMTIFEYADLSPVGAVVTFRKVNPAVPGMKGLTQNFDHSGPFLVSTTADGKKIDTPEPHRDQLAPKKRDGGVTSETVYRDDGLVHTWHTLPSADPADDTGLKENFQYYLSDDAQLFRRGMPKTIVAGDNLTTTIAYEGPDSEVRQTPRGVKTRIDYDEVRRPIHVKVSGPGSIAPEEWFAYDATGRRVRHKRRQADREVEERYEYDVLGRMTRTSTFDGPAEIEVTKYDYNLPARLLRTTLPAGGTVTSQLDGLGRVHERITDPLHPFASATSEKTRYDVDDNVVFTTDGHEAVATRYDAAHRPVETFRSDATRTTMDLDGWGRLVESKQLESGASYKATYTPGGRLTQVATNTMTQDLMLDASGRNSSVVTRRGVGQPVTQSTQTVDTAGRVIDTKVGASNGTSITRLYTHTSLSYGDAEVPATVTTGEDGDSALHSWSIEHDMLGQSSRVANVVSPSFAFDHPRDEAGNVTTLKTPEKPGTLHYKHDARGSVTEEALPGAAQPNRYEYDANGALRRYLDPQTEETKTTNDGLGRPVLRTYPDGSTEEMHYDGERLSEIRDRQGRRQHFVYNSKGQLEQVTEGTTMLEELTYDSAGRMIGWKCRDSKIEFADFDAESRPQTTRQIRLRADGTPIDSYTQKHTYNGSGDRITWTMPSSPLTTTAWTASVDEERDAMGNLIAIRRSASGGSVSLMSADYRTAGPPKSRRVILGSGSAELVREYHYDDATGVGRLTEMRLFSGGQLLAGSKIGFDGLLRTSEQHLGLAAGERSTFWTYDDRGRLGGMLAGLATQSGVPMPGVPGSVLQGLSDADFTTELARTPSAPVGALPSLEFTPKPGGGHKVGTITREGASSESILYQKADGSDGGSQRTEDARFRYEWDHRGNLRKVTEKLVSPAQTTLTRVVYSYNAFDRMVGRRVETATAAGGVMPAESEWKLSNETSSAPAALPPSVTFVWDPISDQLVAMFEAEKYEAGTVVPSGRPLRQFIHGGMGLDDPIEVTVADPSAASGVQRYYPILDEAGTGSLQAVVGETGRLLARTFHADPYGEDASTITEPAVDRVSIRGTKDQSGALAEVKVSIHLTEPVDVGTLPSGARLASVTASGSVVKTAATAATVAADPYTVEWSVAAAEWQTLTSGSQTTALSIAVTSALRSTTFGPSVPLLFPQSSPSGVFASPERPFELREPLATISEQIANTPAAGSFSSTPYSVLSIATVGTRGPTDIGAALVFSPFKAHPFSDPYSRLDYVRARWYSPEAGTWLTPDPVGYRDSSNLYAYCGGDPVNCSDPEGLQSRSDLADDRRAIQERLAKEYAAQRARDAAACKADPLSSACLSPFGRFVLESFGDTKSKQLSRVGANKGARSAGYINGVNTSPQGAMTSAALLTNLYSVPIDPLFNTSRGLGFDLMQAALVNKAMSLPDASTKMIVKYLQSEVRGLKPGETKLMIAHSQGSAILSTALQYISPQERALIDVLTFGDAAWSFPSGLHSLRSVVNVFDPIPTFTGSEFVAWTEAERDIKRVGFGFLPFGTHYMDNYMANEQYLRSPAAAAADDRRRQLTIERMNRK